MTALLIVTYSLAGILILVGIVGRRGIAIERVTINPVPRRQRIAALGFGTLFLVVALFFSVIIGLNEPGLNPASPNLGTTSPTQPPDTHTHAPTNTPGSSEPTTDPSDTAQPHIDFAIPREGGTVQHDQEIQGTAFGIPSDRYLWIVLQPKSVPKYFPQPYTVTPGVDGKFETRVRFGAGPDTDKGEKFSILAVVASREASDKFTRYLEEGEREGGNFPGLDSLPDGTKIAQQITVVRQ